MPWSDERLAIEISIPVGLLICVALADLGVLPKHTEWIAIGGLTGNLLGLMIYERLFSER